MNKPLLQSNKSFPIVEPPFSESIMLYYPQFTWETATRGKIENYSGWRASGLVSQIGAEWNILFTQNVTGNNSMQQHALLNFFEFIFARLVYELRSFNIAEKEIKSFGRKMLSPYGNIQSVSEYVNGKVSKEQIWKLQRRKYDSVNHLLSEKALCEFRNNN